MDVIFQMHPVVELATNLFYKVPIILQYEQTPLLEVGNFIDAGYTTRFPVYHNDGTKIANVVGRRIFLAKSGKNLNLALKHETDLTACELEGKTILELRRRGAAAIYGSAELYAPEGILIKANSLETSAGFPGGEPFFKNVLMVGNKFLGVPVGIHITKHGISFGGFVHPPEIPESPQS